MGLFTRILGSVKEQYIARPQEASRELIWRHPNQNIPRGSKLTVRADERVVFFKHGILMGTLAAGEHLMEEGTVPFLDALVVRPITGGDHYVAELFFVRDAEHIHHVQARDLGTFNDIASRHVVTIHFSARFAVRVTRADALITTLGGQWEGAAARVGEFLDARLRSLLSAAVGQLLSTMPVLQVVSNQHNEMIGRHVQQAAAPEFEANGLMFTRFLELEFKLDEASAAALRDFGSAQADLSIQREGASLAVQPGFMNYHLVQGQRAALEGLGQGLSTGNMHGVGLGLGGMAPLPAPAPMAFTGSAASLPLPAQPSTLDVRAVRPAGALETTWYLKTERGAEGPLTAKQLSMRLAAEPGDPGAREVQAAGSGTWQLLSSVPGLAALFPAPAPALPAPTSAPAPASAAPSFEALLRAQGSNRALQLSDVDEFVLALSREQPGADMPSVRAQAARRLRARGFQFPEDG
jgi:membrane protease subunit (stomatin/prohibitin family)